MSVSEIHIDRLQLDLRGIPASVAQSAWSDLGPALHAAIAARLTGPRASTGATLASVAMPAVRVPAGADAATLRAAVVSQVADAIAAQLSPASPASLPCPP